MNGTTAYVLAVVPEIFATASFIAVTACAVVPAVQRR